MLKYLNITTFTEKIHYEKEKKKEELTSKNTSLRVRTFVKINRYLYAEKLQLKKISALSS